MDNRKTNHEELDSWLAVALAGLCSDAKDRVSAEIEGHYLDAMESLRLEGRSDKEARALAIAGLGSPKKAGRAFRKNHLTAWQAQFLEEPNKKYLRLRIASWSVLMGAAMVMSLGHLDTISGIVGTTVTILLMMASMAGHFWMAPRLRRRRFHKGALEVDLLSNWLFFASLLIGTAFVRNGYRAVMVPAVEFAVIGGAFLLFFYPVAKKLNDKPSSPA